jgi:preprotein translocase subunit YajC
MINFCFALAAPGSAPGAGGAPNPIVSLFPIIIIFVIFYLLLIKPQQKKQKEHQQMLLTLKKNDEVITAGGIHGTIVNVKDRTFVLRIDENTKVEIEKTSVSTVKKSRAES